MSGARGWLNRHDDTISFLLAAAIFLLFIGWPFLFFFIGFAVDGAL